MSRTAPPITDYETALPEYLAPRSDDAPMQSPAAVFDGYDRPFGQQTTPLQPSPQYLPPHTVIALTGTLRATSDTAAPPLGITPPTTIRAASAYKSPLMPSRSALRHSQSIDNTTRSLPQSSSSLSTTTSVSVSVSPWENSPQIDVTPSPSFRWFRYELDNDIRPHKSLCAFTGFNESVIAVGRLSETSSAMAVYELPLSALNPALKTQNFKISMSKLLIQETRKSVAPGSAHLIGEEFPFWKTNWRALTTDGDIPSVRVGASVAQISSNELLLFGGVNYENHESYSDVYVLNMETFIWRKIQPNSDSAPWPSPRSYHASIVYMPPLDRSNDTAPHRFDTTTLLVFGGCECHDTGIPNTFLSDFWSFDLISYEWTLHTPTGVGPTGRCQSSILLLDEILVIASGLNGTTILADYFSLDFQSLHWERLLFKSPVGMRTPVLGMTATYGPLPIVERNAFSTRIPISVQAGASAADRELCSKIRSILARGGFMIGDTIGFVHPETEAPRPIPLFCIDLENREIAKARYHDAVVTHLEDVHPRIAAGLNATPRQVLHNDAAVALFNSEQCAFHIIYVTTEAVYTLSMNEALTQAVNLMEGGRIPWRFGTGNVETVEVDDISDESMEGMTRSASNDSPGMSARKHSGMITPLWTRLMGQVRGEIERDSIETVTSPTETREEILDYTVEPQNLFASAEDRIPSPTPAPVQSAAVARKRCAHCHHECAVSEMTGAFCHAMCAAAAARQLRAAQSPEGSYAHLSQPLPSWSQAHVLEWLKTFGDAFEPYIENFKNARISGRELIHVDDTILHDELGVNSSLHRKTMLAEIAAGISIPFEKESGSAANTDEGDVSPCSKVSAPIGGTSMMIIRHSELTGIAQLGEGNFGTTYKANLPSMWNSGVVIKVPKGKSGIAEWNELQAFMNAPPHPNVLPLLGICPDWPSPHPNSICFVTLFMQNGSLKDILNDNVKCAHMLGKHPFDQTADQLTDAERGDTAFKEFINRSIELFIQTARGLNHLHANRLIHRDISCRNILVGSLRDVYVSDFGLSRRVSGEGDGENTDDLKAYYKVHNPSDTMLPYRWMSPESMESFVFTRHSDVWSFGVVCWEILTRAKTVPYSAIQRINTVMVKVCGGSLKLTLPAWCPSTLAALIHRCWELEPTDRPSMAEVIEQLKTIREDFNRV